LVSAVIGCLPWDWRTCLHDGQQHSEKQEFHNPIIVTQKLLTIGNYCNTVLAAMWEGVVEVFALHRRPKATRAYAWSHDTDGPKKRHVTVLHVAPITSAVMTVRAAILQEQRNLGTEES
jgi:hypothetical protein